MRNRRLLLSLLLPAAFFLLSIAAGYLLWRVGFLPADQSFLERAVTVVCLGMICLSPLGILLAFVTNRAAKKQASQKNSAKAAQLRVRSLRYVVRSVLDIVLGGAGYYVVTRRVFPQIEVTWILMGVVLPTALIEIAFRLKFDTEFHHQT